jgi:hypothetical protein
LGRIEKLKNISVTNNPPPSPFTKGGIITPPFSKGMLRGIFILTNSKGISVLFLVIAMMLMVTIGIVFSYLIPTKQKGVSFPIHSIKAFYLAQSGVEFAVRYAIATYGANPTPANLVGLTGVTRNLGDRNGSFTLNYDRPNNELTSVGAIPNLSERRITVSNFASFLRTPKGVILDPRSASPCWVVLRRRAQFYIRNAREDSIILTSFSASWTQTGTARNITAIYMGGTQKYTGTYGNGGVAQNLNRPVGNPTQTITSGQLVNILVYWSGNLTAPANNINIIFYTGNLGAGDSYNFDLDSASDGLNGTALCGAGC